MSQTSLDFFTSAAQAAPGTAVWANQTDGDTVALGDVLVNNNAITVSTPASSSSQTVTLTGPKAGAELPLAAPGLTITNIYLEAYPWIAALGTKPLYFSIQGGAAVAMSINSKAQVQYLSGNPAYWGITNVQALSFASGGTATMQDVNPDTSGRIVGCAYVKIRFDYRASTPMPGLF